MRTFTVRPWPPSSARDPGTILGHIGGAMGHDLLTVVLVPTFPVGLIGILAVLAMRRSPALRRATALSALLVSGVLTFLVADVVFPVATVWGTFLHASGPLLVGLSVAAVLGLDAFVARVGRARAWSRPNAWLGPAAVLAVAGLLLALQVLLVTGAVAGICHAHGGRRRRSCARSPRSRPRPPRARGADTTDLTARRRHQRPPHLAGGRARTAGHCPSR